MYDEAAEASLASGYKFTPEHDRQASLQVTFAGFGVHEDARTYSA
jgi:hypothetical protein